MNALMEQEFRDWFNQFVIIAYLGIYSSIKFYRCVWVLKHIFGRVYRFIIYFSFTIMCPNCTWLNWGIINRDVTVWNMYKVCEFKIWINKSMLVYFGQLQEKEAKQVIAKSECKGAKCIANLNWRNYWHIFPPTTPLPHPRIHLPLPITLTPM